MTDQRIGILGGTFNPIHTGHLILAEHAYSEYGLERVLIMPSGVSYQKKNDHVLSAETRVEMVRLAIADNPHFELCEIETKRDGNTYTFETMELLKSFYPNAKLYFILGADNLYGIENWKHAERIFQCCTILAAGRNHIQNSKLREQIEHLEKRFGATVNLMETPEIDISSEMIRTYIENDISVRYLLNDKVIELIRDRQLYGADKNGNI